VHEDFRAELARLGLVALLILLFGMASGAWWLALLIGLGGYILWQLQQLWLFEE